MTAAVALAGAGILHLLQSPMHLDHSWEHAAALATFGAIDLAWALAWLRRRTPAVLYLGAFLTALTVTLYTISRFLPLPFEGTPEEVSALNLATQLLEVAGFVALAGTAALVYRKSRATEIMAGIALIAVLGGWALYCAALLAAALTT